MSKRERIGCFLRHTLRILVMVACLHGVVHEVRAQDGLVVPTAHPRIWWNAERLDRARAWWPAHAFTPSSDDPQGNAFRYLMTGETQYARTAINLLMNFTIPQAQLDGVASDDYRWSPWVPIVYDWCYDLMTPTEVSTFIARYNNYTSILIGKPWGGPGSEGNNYFWGYLVNELNWAIATYYENPMAQTFLNDALVTRWQNGVLPYFAVALKGGTSPEGSSYGLSLLQYPDMAFTTLGLMGLDLFNQTNWYKEAVFNTIYDTSVTPINSIWTQFSYGDDEQGPQVDARYHKYNGSFISVMADAFAGSPVAQYARQWLNTVQPTLDPWIAAVDSGGSSLPFSNLPLDYYSAGIGYLYGSDPKKR